MPFPGDKLKSQHSCIHCVPFSLCVTICSVLLLFLITYITLCSLVFPLPRTQTILYGAYGKNLLNKISQIFKWNIFVWELLAEEKRKRRKILETAGEREVDGWMKSTSKAILSTPTWYFFRNIVFVVSRAFHYYCHCHYSFIRFIACSLLFIVLWYFRHKSKQNHRKRERSGEMGNDELANNILLHKMMNFWGKRKRENGIFAI